MLAADTSSLIAFLAGENGDDVDRIAAAMGGFELVLPPVVITELLSDPDSRASLLEPVLACTALEVLPGYWARAGATRAILLAKKLSAKVADTLIAQSCIDHDVALITRDSSFRHFAAHCGLKLA